MLPSCSRKVASVLALTLAGGFAALSWGCDEKSEKPLVAAPGPRPIVEWPETSRSVFALHMTSHVDTSLSMSRVEFTLDAEVRVHVGPPSGDGQSLLLEMTGARFAAPDNQESFGALAEELERPFGAVLRQGALSEERLAPGLSNFAASIQRTVLGALQVSDRVGEGDWSATEFDSSGQYQASWKQLGEGTFSRTKQKYIPIEVKTPGFPDQIIAPEVTRSLGKYTIKSGRLASVNLEESVALRLGANKVHSDTELSLTQVSASSPEERPQKGPVEWQKLWNATKKHTPGQPYGGTVPRSVFDEQRVGQYTYESALQVLVLESEQREKSQAAGASKEPEDAESGHARAFSALAAILRTQPEARKKAAAQIPKGGHEAGILANALASSGAAASQAELVLLLSADDASKHAAARSLVRVEEPTPETVAAVLGLCGDTRYLKFCYYGAGTFTRRLREQGHTERADELVKFLVGGFKSKKPDERMIILRGFANAGTPESVPLVAPLLLSEDQREREAATDALRLVPGTDVDTLLSERLSKDLSVNVRMSVVSAALVREQSPVLEHAIVQAALHDENSGVRKQAVRAMARWLRDAPELRAPLEKVASEDENQLVKTYAQAALSSDRKDL